MVTGKMAYLYLCKYEDLSSVPQHLCINLGIANHKPVTYHYGSRDRRIIGLTDCRPSSRLSGRLRLSK